MFEAKQGEILALLAACCWSVSSISFARAGRKVGSLTVNLLRLSVAIGFLTIYGRVVRGLWLPTDAASDNWLWLSLSGFVGFFLGDLFLFRAFITIGPRLSTLMMTLAPPIAALTGWIFIDERMGWLKLLGMAITITGVCWVTLERPLDKGGNTIHVSPLGVLCGLLGAAGQGAGVVLSKIGMNPSLIGSVGGVSGSAVEYDPVAAVQIRAFAGIAGFLVLFACLRRFGRIRPALRDRGAVFFISLGAFFGPSLGVALLMRSIQLIGSGVAQTLVATVPVFILPAVILFENERVSRRAVFGAVVAVAGVVLLFK